MENKHVKWHQMTVKAVEEYLNTSASCGLSRKEARSRYRKVGANTLFDRPGDASHILRAFLCDPALLLLCFACILSICFFETAAGIIAIAVLACWGAVLIRILLSAKQMRTAVSKYRMPSVTVLRQGKHLSVAARSLVPGDIIYLKRGDMIPADCRLIFSTDFRVLTLYVDEKNRARYTEYPKSSDVCSQSMLIPNPLAYENMLFGGSEVFEGHGVAIVVSIGKFCLLGGIDGFAIPAEKGEGFIGDQAVARPFFRIYSLALFVLFIPLSVAAWLRAGEETGLLNVFLSLSAWIAGGAVALLSLYLALPSLFSRLRHIIPDKKTSCMILKSARAEKALSEVSELFVLGHGAFTDGILHLHRCSLGDGEVDLTSRTSIETIQPLSEAFCLLRHAKADQGAKNRTVFSDPFADVSRELLVLSGFDTEALAMRLLHCCISAEKADAAILDVKVKSGDFRLLFSQDSRLIDRCTFFEKDRRTVVFSSLQRDNLHHFYHEVHEEAATPLLIIKQVGTQMIFLGMLALRENLCTNVRELLADLQKSGVRVTFFLHGDYESELRYMQTLGLPTPCRIDSDDPEYVLKQINRSRVCFGVKNKTLLALLQRLRKEKIRVAVMGDSGEDPQVFGASSLSVLTETSRSFLRKQPQESIVLSATTNSTNRRHADALAVRDATSSVGGLSAYLSGLLDARAAERKVAAIFRFLITSHITRAAFLVLSVCFAIPIFSGAQMLYAVLFAETIYVVCLATMRIPISALRIPQPLTEKKIMQMLSDFWTWLPDLVCMAVAVLYVFILRLCGLIEREGQISFLFCAILLFQMIAFSRTAMSLNSKQTQKRAWIPQLFVSIPILCGIFLCALIPSLHSVIALAGFRLVTALALPAIPILSFLFGWLFLSFFHRTAK